MGARPGAGTGSGKAPEAAGPGVAASCRAGLVVVNGAAWPLCGAWIATSAGQLGSSDFMGVLAGCLMTAPASPATYQIGKARGARRVSGGDEDTPFPHD